MDNFLEGFLNVFANGVEIGCLIWAIVILVTLGKHFKFGALRVLQRVSLALAIAFIGLITPGLINWFYVSLNPPRGNLF
jgi:hypothetical protein